MRSMIEWPQAGGMVGAGKCVRDRKHPTETGTVLAVWDVPAAEYHVEAITRTVADDNPDYPATDPVVELVWSDLGDDSALADARAAHTVYHFPLSRLVCESCVRDVAPSVLAASPYHHRTFAVDENHNEGYIRKIRSQGYINSLLLARETDAGLELVAGHKRRWVAQQAELDTVAVRVVDLSAWEAAIHYAEDHLQAVDTETALQIVRALVARWGDRVREIPAVQARGAPDRHVVVSAVGE
jgi:ParB family chromosome partitioning protein